MHLATSTLALLLAVTGNQPAEVQPCDCTMPIVDRLDDPDPGVRYWAARVLGAVGDACFAVPALAREASNRTAGVDPEGMTLRVQLKDGTERDFHLESRQGNVIYRESMIEALGRSGDDGAAALAELYDAERTKTSEPARGQLVEIEGHPVELHGDNEDVSRHRVVAAMAAGAETPLRVDFFVRALEDEDELVSTLAAEALVSSAPDLAMAVARYREYAGRIGEWARQKGFHTLLARGLEAKEHGSEALCALVPVCLDALQDPNPEIRVYAVDGLSAFGGCDAELEAQFEEVAQMDPQDRVREAAEEALARTHTPSVRGEDYGSLREVGGGGCMVRHQPWTGELAIAFVDEMLQSDCSYIRRAALVALEFDVLDVFVEPRLAPVLRTLLTDADVAIRRLAVARVGCVFDLDRACDDDSSAVGPLLDLLAPALRDPDSEVRRVALFQLSRCEALAEATALAEADRAITDPDASVRAAGLELLSYQTRSDAVNRRLIRALDDPDNQVASTAAEALSDVWRRTTLDEPGIEAIAGKARSPSPVVRQRVAVALAGFILDSASAWEAFEYLASDEDADVRDAVAVGLYQALDRRSANANGAQREILERLSRDPFPRVRIYALEALRR